MIGKLLIFMVPLERIELSASSLPTPTMHTKASI